jgi:DNA-binding CsgD family transcriptional regulator
MTSPGAGCRTGTASTCRSTGRWRRRWRSPTRATLIPLPGSGHLFYQGEWEPVLAAALGFLGEPAGAQPRLTGREMEVARLVADGLTNYSIAVRLSIAPRTAEAHVENIRRKLQVRSRAQIAAWITEHRQTVERTAAAGSPPAAGR